MRALSRRAFVARGLWGAAALLAAPWSGAALALKRSGGGRFLEARAAPGMGTVIEAIAVGERPERLAGACEAAFTACRGVERQMSFFDPDSELSALNRAIAAGRSIEVSPQLFDVLSAARQVFEGSRGAFDPSVGASVELFRKARQRGRWPDAALAERAAQSIGMAQVELRPGDRGVRARAAATRLDLSGIAKGYAAGRAAAAMGAAGARAGIVNAGGDLYVFGPERAGSTLVPPVALADPFTPGALRHRLGLLEEALATSGDAEQGIWLEGRRCSHLIDPATGYPLRAALGSASVRAESAMVADAWASALFVRPELAAAEPAGIESLLIVSATRERASAGFLSRRPRSG